MEHFRLSSKRPIDEDEVTFIIWETIKTLRNIDGCIVYYFKCCSTFLKQRDVKSRGWTRFP